MKLLAQTFIALLLITAFRAQAELVAHWPLDGNAEDLLGNHDGAESGVIFGVEGAANHTGTAAEFNGFSSTITVPFDSAMNPESFTLSMWVNADSTNGFASPVTSRDDTPTSVHGYLVYNDSSGNWNFWTGTGGPSGAWNQMSGGKVEIGSWTHIAVSYDDGSQTKKLYVNGSLASSNSAPNLYDPNGPQSENLHIGSGADSGGAFFFDGLIDDVALWDHALTSAEIKDLMTNGVPGGPPSVTVFEASPPFIDSGQNVTLSWEIKNATSVSISPNVGSVAADRGNVVVTPPETTTYTITAIGESSPAATFQITVGVDVESLDPIITEFLADNKTGLIAPDGNRSDWIELHNPNHFAIDIGGWHLSDDSTQLEKFTFPPGQIPAGGYKIFFADSSLEALNFKLSKTGDYLALSDPNGNLSSEFSPAYPAQFDDVSYGLSSSGTLTYLEPTPGVANGSSRSEIGPKVEGLTRNPLPPTPGEDLVISANITPRIGAIASSKLFYRVGFGTERQLTMTKGVDHQYSATISASAYEAGEMVRWYLIATTTSGESTREPPFPDLTESAQYFGTVISDPSISVDQPVMHWFVKNIGAADTRGGTRGSLYFEGQFYD
ncbi:lamin tail domain-containing protein, partial [bacterium]|nr:lamin tail domain-containing protein [bacterium]